MSVASDGLRSSAPKTLLRRQTADMKTLLEPLFLKLSQDRLSCELLLHDQDAQHAVRPASRCSCCCCLHTQHILDKSPFLADRRSFHTLSGQTLCTVLGSVPFNLHSAFSATGVDFWLRDILYLGLCSRFRS